MKIETIDSLELFQKVLKDFSLNLYPQHPAQNLQCHEAVDKNFSKGFILYSKGSIAATACLINNNNLFYLKQKTICISHYECINDKQTSKFLLQYISNYSKLQGFKILIGPINGSTWNSYRFALEPIQDSYLNETYHKNYYANQFEDFGFKTAAEYLTRSHNSMDIPEVPEFLNKNISYKNLNINNFETEMKNIFAFCIDIFKNNFLYTAISEDEFLHKYIKLKNLINPDYVLIAQHNDNIIGFILALHDIYSQNNKRLIIKTLGRKSGATYAGVAHELLRKIYIKALDNGYQIFLHAFMHHNNASKNISRKLSVNPFRTYKIFYKML